jgi:cytochrome c553
MKRLIAAAALIVFTAGMALAAGPDTISLPSKKGNISFPHKKHQEQLKNCTLCHEKSAGGKIEGLNMTWAHKTCRGCHEEKKMGPTSCGDCHKK